MVWFWIFLATIVSFIIWWFYFRGNPSQEQPKTIEEKVADTLNELPSKNNIYEEIHLPKEVKEEVEKIKDTNREKELNILVQNYIKQNGYIHIQNDVKKQEELKNMITSFMHVDKMDYLHATLDVDVNKQIDNYLDFSNLPLREAESISTGATPLVYLRG